MENNRSIEDQINDYIMGLLDEEATQLFQLELEKNNKLMEKVQLRKELVNALEDYGRNSLKERLKNNHDRLIGGTDAPSVTTPAKRRSLWPYLAAASVLVLVVALFLFNNKDPFNADQLYAAHFQPYDISGMQRSNSDEALLSIKDLYADKKYKEVIPILENQLNNAEVKASPLLLATGIAYLELNQPDQALTYFQQITQNGDFNFKEEVQWYSGLAYLKKGDLKEVKKMMEEIVKNKRAVHYEEAKELMEDL